MPRHHLTLPPLGLEEQSVVASLWLVAQGSRVVEGTPVLEVLAGPATIDLPAPADGVLIEMLVDEDDELTTGQPLALIESDPPAD
ncbi:MAG: lipoyl domain-containing protein [Pirellulales bacterium]|nr:lipoyl domain-containing protein [Pirellulales bacterium]